MDQSPKPTLEQLATQIDFLARQQREILGRLTTIEARLGMKPPSSPR